MKIHRIPLYVIALLILGSLLLSACSGAGVINTWPGVSATQDTVYLSDSGSVYAINASNGTMLWRFPEKPNNSQPFYAAPAVTDTMIVAGSYGHMLHGINKSDGKEKWSLDTQSGNFVGSPLVVSNTILIPSSNDNLYAVSMDGKLLWTFETKNGLWATPASDGQVAYLAALDHNLYALKVSDGTKIWQKDLGSALLGAPVLTKDGTLYVSSMGGNLAAVKASDGSILWTAKLGGNIWDSPLLQGDTLYLGNSDGKVFAVSAKDGKIAWEANVSSPVIAGVAMVKDNIVVPTEGGKVIALDSKNNGKQVWQQTINGKLYSTPVVTGDTVVVAVTQGDKLLQVFNADGQLAWPFVAPK